MSLLVEIRKEQRVVNGAVVKVGETCRLPNALALALEKVGLCAHADGAAQLKAAEAKGIRKAARKAKKKSEK